MALITRLKTFCALERSLRLNLVLKNRLHSAFESVGSAPRNAAPTIRGRSYFLKIFRKRPTEHDFKIKDDVPDAFTLIYRNTMSTYIRSAQIVSLIAGGVILVGFILKSYRQDRHRALERTPTLRTTQNEEEIYYIAVFVTLLVLMQVMISRTPIRIYKVAQKPKYIALSYGNNFLGSDKFRFKRGEIFYPEEKGFLPWKEHRYTIETETDRRSVILLDHYFRRPADLSIMLGEQRDPDLEN